MQGHAAFTSLTAGKRGLRLADRVTVMWFAAAHLIHCTPPPQHLQYVGFTAECVGGEEDMNFARSFWFSMWTASTIGELTSG